MENSTEYRMRCLQEAVRLKTSPVSSAEYALISVEKLAKTLFDFIYD